MYRKILVPLDGSKTAEVVLPHAKALALSEGAELILLNVAANPALDFAFSDPGLAVRAEQDLEAQSEKYMKETEKRLNSEGIRASILLRVGAAANVILGVAEEMQVDLIAMATHGRTGPARWLLGSVADRVVRNSKVPVFLIRAR